MTKFRWGKFKLTKTDKSIRDYEAVQSMPKINIDAHREWEENSYRYAHEHFKDMMAQSEGRQ